MKRFILLYALAVFAVIAGSVNAFASWFVTYPDTAVDPGTTLEYKVSGGWDRVLFEITVPTVVRSIDPGAFWTGALPYDTSGNATSHPFAYNVEWHWNTPWAWLLLEMRPGIPDGCGTTSDMGYDGISPDHFVLYASGVGNGLPATPGGMDFVTLTFDVGNTPGDFEFDTACFTATLSTIYMTDNYFPPVEHGPTGTNEVVFTKGTITVSSGCDCSSNGDCNPDSAINPVDVIYLINYAFRDGPLPPTDLLCPLINRGDWDCNGQVNLLDVVKMINYVYRYLGSPPCDPCIF